MIKSSLKMELPAWADSDSVRQLMEAVDGFGAEPNSMFVGGSVRNSILNEPVSDIDIATKLLPEDIINKCHTEDIKVIPTGIDHGTVTAVVNGQSFEITTLRKDEKTDGRHAEVSFTNDWVEDAQRRDFTINTLLMDMEGHIYDPLSSGLAHIEQRRIVFVGDPSARIQEDYLRILRFFRFYAQYGAGGFDTSALKACAMHANKISSLSRERITSEVLKILAAKHAPKVLQEMFQREVLIDLKVKAYSPEIFTRLITLQKIHKADNVLSRLLVVSGNKARFFDDYLRLSHAQKNFLVKLDMAANNNFYEDGRELKKAIYYHGRELMMQGYLVSCASKNVETNENKLNILNNWIPPECPITGDSLIQEGYVTGPDLGLELKRRQEEWLEQVLDN